MKKVENIDIQHVGGMSFAKRGELDVLLIENENAVASVALYGAHVLSFTPKVDGRDRLWVSSESKLDGSKAIRGGIPVCWPWFAKLHGQADDTLPQHGFVRTQQWRLVAASSDGQVSKVVFEPTSVNGPGFSHSCHLSLTVVVSESLTVSLKTENVGESPFSVGGALHTYFAVSDIHQANLSGLTSDYIDSIDDRKIKDTPSPYTFTGETDRIHTETAKTSVIEDGEQKTTISHEGHDSIVVWNPWKALSESMADMPDDGYLTMLCVETASTSLQAVFPGQSAVLTQQIR